MTGGAVVFADGALEVTDSAAEVLLKVFADGALGLALLEELRLLPSALEGLVLLFPPHQFHQSWVFCRTVLPSAQPLPLDP